MRYEAWIMHRYIEDIVFDIISTLRLKRELINEVQRTVQRELFHLSFGFFNLNGIKTRCFRHCVQTFKSLGEEAMERRGVLAVDGMLVTFAAIRSHDSC